eukprot:TRINITY_DN6607_c0_g1_i5.p1 TRINITY_DN6607_c0_g1~~TRINITY_DN6607_c0_g1_i5.p1  ORF type:complete len:202 (+),score=40.72 TRINITY_DN6607_c0_g1_i5:307-912(+)
MGRALHFAIAEHVEDPTPHRLDHVFSEKHKPLDSNCNFNAIPTIGNIEYFLALIFNAEQLSAECGVMAMAYIERLTELTGLKFKLATWRKIVLGALIVASKVWEDQAVWNVDFLSVFPNVNVRDLNRLERQYLTAIQFMVSLKSSVYARYYFELRALSDKDENHFPLDPLDHESQEKLELRSKGIEEEELAKRPKKSQSVC